jgi:hypothetical protein
MTTSAIKIHYKYVILILVFSILIPCCGKKSPPQPQQVQLPLITDLTADINKDLLTLSWTASKNFSEFTLYESKTPLSADCNNCPLDFKPVEHARISGNISGNTQKLQCTIKLQKGFQYVYKLRLSDKNSHTYSNNVKFTY